MKRYVIVGSIAIILIISVTFAVIYWQNKKIYSKIEQKFDNLDYDGAITSAEKKIVNQPNDIDALLLLAATYAQKGSVSFHEEDNAQKAIMYADQVIALDPLNSEAYRIKGYALEIQEQYELAHTNYDKAIELNKENSLAYSNKGHAYDLEGKEDEAVKWYGSALKINPNNSHALLNLARVQTRKEQFDAAEITLDSLFASQPHDRFKAEGYQILAYIKSYQEDFGPAYDAIEKSLSIDPTIPQSWVLQARLNLGEVFEIDNETEMKELLASVEADAKKALAINPNQTSAYIVLSEMQVISSNKTLKEEYRQKALQAIDLDITLGKAEKENVRRYLTSKIKVIK